MGVCKDHALLGKPLDIWCLKGFGYGLSRGHELDSEVSACVPDTHVVRHK